MSTLSNTKPMTSQKSFILALSGAAIGIGSIWRMPYIIGEQGGALFILIYFIFLILLGIPAMMAEIVIGKIGRKHPKQSIVDIAKKSKSNQHWGKLAYLATFCAALILSFYGVISGWGLRYFNLSLMGTSMADQQGNETLFNQFLNNPIQGLGYSSLFFFMTFAVSAFEIHKGIERLNNILMPILYLIIFLLLLYAMQLPGLTQALKYLLYPDWSKLTIELVSTAMGLAFFTLATGAGCLMAYGAYIPVNQSIIKSSWIVALLNLLVIICIGISIFTVVFSYNINTDSGPGLLFIVIPLALSNMPLGYLIMPFFFFLLIVACWTSSVNLAEPLVTAFSHRFNNRLIGSTISGILIWLMSLIPLLSFNIFKSITIGHQDLFSFYTAFASDFVLPISGLLILWFVGQAMNRTLFINNIGSHPSSAKFWLFLIRFISPGLLMIVLITKIITLVTSIL
ncbi:MAG: sodium-dependent transporter [Endozoicomonadaceae bacterium]|nr:sodium-dependent transporter [Endozoicomonadaceae bacterium]